MRKLSIVFAFFMLVFSNFAGAQAVGTVQDLRMAYHELYNRDPSQWELVKENYNSGTWANYNELKNFIKEYQATVSSQKIVVTNTVLSGGKVGVLFNQGGKPLAVNLISQDGGGLVASGGGNLRLPAADVSKLVASGGGNLVASGGGNLVASGGGNIAGVGFGSNYGTLAVGAKRIPVSGKGAWIIK
jgi:hypothetical protein